MMSVTATFDVNASDLVPQWSAAVEEKIKDFTPSAQAAVRKYWGSVVMRTHRAFADENADETQLASEKPIVAEVIAATTATEMAETAERHLSDGKVNRSATDTNQNRNANVNANTIDDDRVCGNAATEAKDDSDLQAIVCHKYNNNNAMSTTKHQPPAAGAVAVAAQRVRAKSQDDLSDAPATVITTTASSGAMAGADDGEKSWKSLSLNSQQRALDNDGVHRSAGAVIDAADRGDAMNTWNSFHRQTKRQNCELHISESDDGDGNAAADDDENVIGGDDDDDEEPYADDGDLYGSENGLHATWQRPNSDADVDQRKTWRSFEEADGAALSMPFRRTAAGMPLYKIDRELAALQDKERKQRRQKEKLRQSKSMIELRRAKLEEMRSIKIFQKQHLQRLQRLQVQDHHLAEIAEASPSPAGESEALAMAEPFSRCASQIEYLNSSASTEAITANPRADGGQGDDEAAADAANISRDECGIWRHNKHDFKPNDALQLQEEQQQQQQQPLTTITSALNERQSAIECDDDDDDEIFEFFDADLARLHRTLSQLNKMDDDNALDNNDNDDDDKDDYDVDDEIALATGFYDKDLERIYTQFNLIDYATADADATTSDDSNDRHDDRDDDYNIYNDDDDDLPLPMPHVARYMYVKVPQFEVEWQTTAHETRAKRSYGKLYRSLSEVASGEWSESGIDSASCTTPSYRSRSRDGDELEMLAEGIVSDLKLNLDRILRLSRQQHASNNISDTGNNNASRRHLLSTSPLPTITSSAATATLPPAHHSPTTPTTTTPTTSASSSSYSPYLTTAIGGGGGGGRLLNNVNVVGGGGGGAGGSDVGVGGGSGVRSCNCCPYGYHIDLDFVRYCEALANAKPSEEELQRRNRRRSRKSMEFMLGLESLFDQWDVDARVHAVPEAAHESDSPDSPLHTSALLSNGSGLYTSTPLRPRSSSVPRLNYGGSQGGRAESPFGTASSTCSSLMRGAESDVGAAPYALRRVHGHSLNAPEQRAFLRDALDEVCSDFERTLERASGRRRKSNSSSGGDNIYGGIVDRWNSDWNNNSTTKPLHNGHDQLHGHVGGGSQKYQRSGGGGGYGKPLWSTISTLPPTPSLAAAQTDFVDSCVAGNKSPRASRAFTRSNTSPFLRRPSPAEQQYESYVQSKVVQNAKSPVETTTNAALTATSAPPQPTTAQQQPKLQQPPPPPPPRRHGSKLVSPAASNASVGGGTTPSTLLSPASLSDGTSGGGGGAPQVSDAQTLCNIREQMALSLKRMRDLEEQVKTIPELQIELTRLRDEKQQLAQTLQRREDELLQRNRERDREREHSSSSSPVTTAAASAPSASATATANGKTFTPQRISPIALESLGARLQPAAAASPANVSMTSSSSSSSSTTTTTTLERIERRSPPRKLTRDIAVGSPTLLVRTVGTQPQQTLGIGDTLYTHHELDAQIQLAITRHDEERTLHQLKRLISVGTQMFTPQRDARDTAVQTSALEPPQVLRYAVGVQARPPTRENFVQCKPHTRTIASSEDRVTDVVCVKCASTKRSVACGTDAPPASAAAAEAPEPATEKLSLSLKQLDMPPRSATFIGLGEHERLHIAGGIRKSTGTQCTPPALVHSIGSQTHVALVQSVGVQNTPMQQNAGTQCQADSVNRQTDTRDLVRLCATQTSTEEICAPAPAPPLVAAAVPAPVVVAAPPPPAPPPPVATRTTGSNTDAPAQRTAVGVNTAAPAAIRHSASNTDQVRKRDIGCGDIVKPHISIACAANYCDSCKDAIKNLAKDFSKVSPSPSSSSSVSGSALPLATARTTAGSNANGQASAHNTSGNGSATTTATTPTTDSRIPRPKHLTSPSPVRKQFQRQNTYTITPSPTPSPVAEKKNLVSSLHEKPPLPSFHQLEGAPETQSFISEPPLLGSIEEKQTTASPGVTRRPPVAASTATPAVNATRTSKSTPNKVAASSEGEETSSSPLTTTAQQQTQEQKQNKLSSQESPSSPEAYELTHAEAGDLIVREEKRVSISWSRDASPAPLRSLESSFNEKLLPPDDSSNTTSSTTSNDLVELTATPTATARVGASGARKKISPIKSSQIDEEHEDEERPDVPLLSTKPPSKALLQKLAMVEAAPRNKIAPSKEMLAALKVISDSLLKRLGAKPISSSSLKASKLTIQQDWFRISSTEKANPHEVEDYLDCFEAMSVPLLEYCVNMVDGNGNTAMHYAVSHGNFDVVSILLDSKVCNVNQMNNAGYTCVMLVSLAKLKNPAHRIVVERLFQMADVNIRAKKHCQTALMLAVSHGNSDMVEMLLAAGADINIQDEDGSTALMCAAEHGRVEIVKHLLSQSDCDSLIQDMDGSTAFKIAWQANHRDISLLLYVHEQMLRSKMPNRGENQPRTPSLSPRHHKRQPSQ